MSVGTRIQGLKLGLGVGKQTNITTLPGSPSWLLIEKTNLDVFTSQHKTETDEDWIGKGNEFATQVFAVNKELGGRIEKFGSAEFVTYGWAYALGGVSFAGGIYTLTPQDPGTNLELPYFPVVQQLAEGGGQAIDELLYGCTAQEVDLQFQSGPGLQSVKQVLTIMGSGKYLTPSAVTLPSVLTEHYMLSQSLTLSILGTDYVANGIIDAGHLNWNNNPLGPSGYFPGSGEQDNAALRGRTEMGKRKFSFDFTARLTHTSPEFAALTGQTTGTAVITLTYDATHTVTFTIQKVIYQALERTQKDGIVMVHVTTAPEFDPTNGILTVSAQCGIDGIAQ